MFFFFSLSFAFFIFAYKTLRKRVWVRISNIGVPSWISWRLIPKSAVFTLKRFKGDYPRTLYHEADFLQMKFFLINSLSLRRWLGTSYNHVVFVFDINVCNFRFDTQLFETVRIWERLHERSRIQSLLQFFTTFSKWRNTISPLGWAAFWTGI